MIVQDPGYPALPFFSEKMCEGLSKVLQNPVCALIVRSLNQEMDRRKFRLKIKSKRLLAIQIKLGPPVG